MIFMYFSCIFHVFLQNSILVVYSKIFHQFIKTFWMRSKDILLLDPERLFWFSVSIDWRLLLNYICKVQGKMLIKWTLFRYSLSLWFWLAFISVHGAFLKQPWKGTSPPPVFIFLTRHKFYHKTTRAFFLLFLVRMNCCLIHNLRTAMMSPFMCLYFTSTHSGIIGKSKKIVSKWEKKCLK